MSWLIDFVREFAAVRREVAGGAAACFGVPHTSTSVERRHDEDSVFHFQPVEFVDVPRSRDWDPMSQSINGDPISLERLHWDMTLNPPCKFGD